MSTIASAGFIATMYELKSVVPRGGNWALRTFPFLSLVNP